LSWDLEGRNSKGGTLNNGTFPATTFLPQAAETDFDLLITLLRSQIYHPSDLAFSTYLRIPPSSKNKFLINGLLFSALGNFKKPGIKLKKYLNRFTPPA
jgi:hypothetical protein